MAEYAEMVEKVVAEVGETNVGAAFGEPRQIGERMVIPVGKVAYGWGGGGGKGHMPQQNQEGEGGGLGMGATVKPIGYINVTPGDASYRPIVDWNTVASVGTFLLGLAAIRLIRRHT